MPDFSIRKEDLSHATIEDMDQTNRDCEEYWFLANQKVGYSWSPTRQLAVDAQRTAYRLLDESIGLARKLRISVIAEGIAIFALFILLLLK